MPSSMQNSTNAMCLVLKIDVYDLNQSNCKQASDTSSNGECLSGLPYPSV